MSDFQEGNANNESSTSPMNTSDDDLTNSEAEDALCSGSNNKAEEPFDYISGKGNVLGKVVIIPTKVGELVHGKVLGKNERKVRVIEVYPGKEKEAEEEEFIAGSFLRVERSMLKRVPFARAGSKKKGRGNKIGLSPAKWAVNKRKRKRNSGQAYVSRSGKKVQAKKFQNKICSCKFKNCATLSEEVRRDCHDKFWAIGDYNAQNAYLLTLVNSVEKKRVVLQKEGVTSEPKTKMRVYTVKGVSLWKEVFKTTFNTSNGRLGRLLQSHDKNPEALHKDQRGSKENHGIGPRVIETLIKIVKKLPKYTFHYARDKESDNTVLLEPDWQWVTVYEMLEEELPIGVKLPSKTWFLNRVKTLFPHMRLAHYPQTM